MNATPAEVAQALAKLGAADLLRLELFAKVRARSISGVSAHDLVNDAVDRALSGERKWNKDDLFLGFMHDTIKSIAFAQRKRHRQRPIVTEADLPVGDDDEFEGKEQDNAYGLGMFQGPGPERQSASDQALAETLEKFADDAEVLAVFNGWLEGLTPDEVCEKAAINRVQYESAQKRIRRWAHKNEPSYMLESIA